MGDMERDCDLVSVILIFVGAFVSFIVAQIIAWFCYRQWCRRYEDIEPYSGDYESLSDESSEISLGEVVDIPPHFHIPLEECTIVRENWGEGQHGTIQLCQIRNTLVVAKTLKQGSPMASYTALVSELKIWLRLGAHNNDNIASFLGAYWEPGERIRIYTEFYPLKDLLSFILVNREIYRNILGPPIEGIVEPVPPGEENEEALRRHPLSQFPFFLDPVELDEARRGVRLDPRAATRADLDFWWKGILNGMIYIQDQQLVHGDLALRNIFLTIDKQVKIGDLGSSIDLGVDQGVQAREVPALIPWAWLPPETLETRMATMKTDSWSFGVVLWEIFSLGCVPYSRTPYDAHFIAQLKHGRRLPRPPHAHQQMQSKYEYMLACWRDIEERPVFSEMANWLQ